MPFFFARDVGVVLTFKVTENGGPVDLSSATSITLLIGSLALPCTIPPTSADFPTYTTTGGEGIPVGSTAAQLRIEFSPTRIYHTKYFQIFTE